MKLVSIHKHIFISILTVFIFQYGQAQQWSLQLQVVEAIGQI